MTFTDAVRIVQTQTDILALLRPRNLHLDTQALEDVEGQPPERVVIMADEETGELAAEVEAARGSFNPFDASALNAADYRRRLDAAIEQLPSLQRRIIEMIRQGFPIDSNDGSVTTIAGSLGRNEKTIRLQRDKAYAALRAELTSGE